MVILPHGSSVAVTTALKIGLPSNIDIFSPKGEVTGMAPFAAIIISMTFDKFESGDVETLTAQLVF